MQGDASSETLSRQRVRHLRSLRTFVAQPERGGVAGQTPRPRRGGGGRHRQEHRQTKSGQTARRPIRRARAQPFPGQNVLAIGQEVAPNGPAWQNGRLAPRPRLLYAVPQLQLPRHFPFRALRAKLSGGHSLKNGTPGSSRPR